MTDGHSEHSASDRGAAVRGAASELFRLFAQSVSEYAMVLLSVDGRIASWNLGAVDQCGYLPDEILANPASRLYPADDVRAGRPERSLELAARDGQYAEEGWTLRKDGSRFWSSVSITALRNEAGQLLGFGRIARDLSDNVGNNEQFRRALEAAPTGMMLVNSEGNIVLVNAEIERLFGYARRELMGMRVEELVPFGVRERHCAHRVGFQNHPRARPMGAGRDLHGLRKDGGETPIEIALNPLQTSQGDFVLTSVVDITERKRAERERDELLRQLKALNGELEQRVSSRTQDLMNTLEERELLLQEIHHRVKNNLSVIASLLEMQSRQLGQGLARDALDDCRGRVHTIALIHETLYQAKNFAAVAFADYVRQLARDVFAATGTSLRTVSLDLAVDDVAIGLDRAIPCALIVNELITNALRHAFPDGRSGNVNVVFSRTEDGRLRLVVSDNGVGLGATAKLRDARSLGLRLVSTLTKQLAGALEMGENGGAGARFELTFPE